MKRPRIAVRYWEKALSLAGHKDELIYNLGNAFFDLGEFDKAIDCYGKVRKRSLSVYSLAVKNKMRAKRKKAATTFSEKISRGASVRDRKGQAHADDS